jgi:hypothetical protein
MVTFDRTELKLLSKKPLTNLLIDRMSSTVDLHEVALEDDDDDVGSTQSTAASRDARKALPLSSSSSSSAHRVLFKTVVAVSVPVVAILSALIAVLVLTQSPCASIDDSVVLVDTVVIGGGLGGLYFTERLLALSGGSNAVPRDGTVLADGVEFVTILEQEPVLGGRVVDVVFSDVPAVWAGLGPWRFLAQQHELVAAEVRRFGLRTVPFDVDQGPQWFHVGADLINGDDAAARTAMMRRHFPSLDANLTADAVLAALLARRDEYADSGGFNALIRQFYGVDGERLMSLLAPTWMSHGDLWSSLDIPGVLPNNESVAMPSVEHADDVLSIVGGWSRMVLALAAEIDKAAPRASVRLSHEVRAIEEVSDGDGALAYYVDAVIRNGSAPFKQVTFKARNVVLATTVPAINALGGNIAERLQTHPVFRSVLPVQVAKAAAVWPSAWWEAPVAEGGLGTPANASAPGAALHSLDECFNIYKYRWGYGHGGETVAHNSYITGECAAWIGDMLRVGNVRSATAELHRSMRRMFPKLSVQPPIDAAFRAWPAGWHLQQPHTFTMAEVAQWAVSPLQPTSPRVSLVGEAFSGGPRGWVNPAWRLVQDVLKTKF